MSDQWTDNPDAASDDAPEVLPDTVTEGSREADSVAEGLDAAVGVDSADDPDASADDADAVRVMIGDRVLRVPSRVRPALEHVAQHVELAPLDLPLDHPSALVLCRRLVREGLLEVVR